MACWTKKPLSGKMIITRLILKTDCRSILGQTITVTESLSEGHKAEDVLFRVVRPNTVHTFDFCNLI